MIKKAAEDPFLRVSAVAAQTDSTEILPDELYELENGIF